MPHDGGNRTYDLWNANPMALPSDLQGQVIGSVPGIVRHLSSLPVTLKYQIHDSLSHVGFKSYFWREIHSLTCRLVLLFSKI